MKMVLFPVTFFFFSSAWFRNTEAAFTQSEHQSSSCRWSFTEFSVTCAFFCQCTCTCIQYLTGESTSVHASRFLKSTGQRPPVCVCVWLKRNFLTWCQMAPGEANRMSARWIVQHKIIFGDFV